LKIQLKSRTWFLIIQFKWYWRMGKLLV